MEDVQPEAYVKGCKAKYSGEKRGKVWIII
jgi:hypothetical protein